ncbi:MAG: hypothetical protein ACLT0Y_06430 [Christensenellales bacterium]
MEIYRSMQKEKQVRTMSFKVPDTLVPVAMVPDFELSTAKAHNVLPHVPLKDATFNTAVASFWRPALPKGKWNTCCLPWRIGCISPIVQT